MAGSIVAIVVIAVLLALVVLLVVLGRGSSGPRVKPEFLGAPASDRTDPLIRAESRHHDTPAAADVEQHGGREHDERP
jgi:hypothetical protein